MVSEPLWESDPLQSCAGCSLPKSAWPKRSHRCQYPAYILLVNSDILERSGFFLEKGVLFYKFLLSVDPVPPLFSFCLKASSQSTMVNDPPRYSQTQIRCQWQDFLVNPCQDLGLIALAFFLKPWHILGKDNLEMFSLGSPLWLWRAGCPGSAEWLKGAKERAGREAVGSQHT